MHHNALDKLLENLRESRKTYASLLAVAEQKQHHILENDIESLRADLQSEEDLAGEGTRLNTERNELHTQCRRILNARPDTRRIEDLCEYMPPEWNERFETERIGLRQTLERLHTVNRTNVSLVNNSLHLLDGLLSAVFGAERTSAYGCRGERSQSRIPVRTLDASA